MGTYRHPPRWARMMKGADAMPSGSKAGLMSVPAAYPRQLTVHMGS